MKRRGVEDNDMLDEMFVRAPRLLSNVIQTRPPLLSIASSLPVSTRQTMNWTIIASTSAANSQTTLFGASKVLLAAIDLDTLSVLSLSVCHKSLLQAQAQMQLRAAIMKEANQLVAAFLKNKHIPIVPSWQQPSRAAQEVLDRLIITLRHELVHQEDYDDENNNHHQNKQHIIKTVSVQQQQLISLDASNTDLNDKTTSQWEPHTTSISNSLFAYSIPFSSSSSSSTTPSMSSSSSPSSNTLSANSSSLSIHNAAPTSLTPQSSLSSYNGRVSASDSTAKTALKQRSFRRRGASAFSTSSTLSSASSDDGLHHHFHHHNQQHHHTSTNTNGTYKYIDFDELDEHDDALHSTLASLQKSWNDTPFVTLGLESVREAMEQARQSSTCATTTMQTNPSTSSSSSSSLSFTMSPAAMTIPANTHIIGSYNDSTAAPASTPSSTSALTTFSSSSASPGINWKQLQSLITSSIGFGASATVSNTTTPIAATSDTDNNLLSPHVPNASSTPFEALLSRLDGENVTLELQHPQSTSNSSNTTSSVHSHSSHGRNSLELFHHSFPAHHHHQQSQQQQQQIEKQTAVTATNIKYSIGSLQARDSGMLSSSSSSNSSSSSSLSSKLASSSSSTISTPIKDKLQLYQRLHLSHPHQHMDCNSISVPASSLGVLPVSATSSSRLEFAGAGGGTGHMTSDTNTTNNNIKNNSTVSINNNRVNVVQQYAGQQRQQQRCHEEQAAGMVMREEQEDDNESTFFMAPLPQSSEYEGDGPSSNNNSSSSSSATNSSESYHNSNNYYTSGHQQQQTQFLFNNLTKNTMTSNNNNNDVMSKGGIITLSNGNCNGVVGRVGIGAKGTSPFHNGLHHHHESWSLPDGAQSIADTFAAVTSTTTTLPPPTVSATILAPRVASFRKNPAVDAVSFASGMDDDASDI